MNDADKAVVRACLEQVEVGMAEARGVSPWWVLLPDDVRQRYLDLLAEVRSMRHVLER